MGSLFRPFPDPPHRRGQPVLAPRPPPSTAFLIGGDRRAPASYGSRRAASEAAPSAPLSGGGGRGGSRGSLRRGSPVPCLDAEERRVQADVRPSPLKFLVGGSLERDAGAMGMGLHLNTPKTESFLQDGKDRRVRYGLASMQAWRTTIEDAVSNATLPQHDVGTSFFGVFHGHGGKSVAKFCAKYLHVQVLKYEANSADSLCVISRTSQAYNLSRNHKPDLATESEMIKGAGGFIVAGRVNGSLNLSRAIGDMELKTNERLTADRQIVSAEPEVNTVQLSENDEFIVLACDGIWWIVQEDSLSAVCEKMLDLCLAPEAGGDGCDSMTVIVVQFKKLTKSAAITSSAKQSPASAEELRPNEPDDPTTPLKKLCLQVAYIAEGVRKF